MVSPQLTWAPDGSAGLHDGRQQLPLYPTSGLAQQRPSLWQVVPGGQQFRIFQQPSPWWQLALATSAHVFGMHATHL
jgi:hypothetical protein